MKIINIITYFKTVFCLVFFISALNATMAVAQNLLDKVPGTIINFSDESTGKYLGTPSICKLPNGYLIATQDVFGPAAPTEEPATTMVYLSRDAGKSWFKTTELLGQFWSKVFQIDGTLYIIGVTNAGSSNLVIRRSTDMGFNWTLPEDKKTGLISKGQYHTSSVPVVQAYGRIWKAVESVNPDVKGWPRIFDARVFSAPIGSDLLDAGNWKESRGVSFDPSYLGGEFNGWLEGNAVKGPDGMYNVLRTHTPKLKNDEYAALIRISEDGKKSSFDDKTGFVKMPGGAKKFSILYDEKSRLYYTLSNALTKQVTAQNYKGSAAAIRNTVVLCSSPDLRNWTIHKVIITHPEFVKHGFQYIDWDFDNEDMIFVSRTGFDIDGKRKASYHDSNLFTFHRIENFRSLVSLTVSDL